MTQQELALAARLSRSSVANIELGTQAITIAQVMAIAAALEVDISTLIPSSDQFTKADDDESQRLMATYSSILRA